MPTNRAFSLHAAMLALGLLAWHPPSAYSQSPETCPQTTIAVVGTTLTRALAAVSSCGALIKGQWYKITLPSKPEGPAVAVFSWPASPTAVLALTAKSSQDFFSVAVYDEKREPLFATYAPASEQQLRVPESVESGKQYYVEVVFENATTGGTGEFMLTEAPAAALQAMAFRRVIDGKTYTDLLKFARCDTAAREACSPTDDDARAFFEGLTPGDAQSDQEPLVAFVGLGGSNRIMLVNKGGNNRYTPRHVTALPAVEWLWVLYLEDDQSPFETSIDVVFKPRAAKVDFEEFDPANLVNQVSLTADTQRGAESKRVIRVGLRRVRVRNPPVAIEVAYSRLGVGYGLRQWRRVYHQRSRSPVAIGAGIFVPFTDVKVESHKLIEPGLSDGTEPNFSVITPALSERPIFAMASLYAPSWRNLREEALTRAAKIGWTIAPELVVGMGLPPKKNSQVYYVGLGWAVALDRIGFTAGMLVSHESRLREGYFAGKRLDNKTTPISTFAEPTYVAKFTLGMTVNLLGIGKGF